MPQAIELNLLWKVKTLKHFIQTALPESTVIFPNIVDSWSNCTARLKISNLNKYLNSLDMDIVGNRNVWTGHLTSSRFHLSRHEKGSLAMNLTKRNYEN